MCSKPSSVRMELANTFLVSFILILNQLCVMRCAQEHTVNFITLNILSVERKTPPITRLMVIIPSERYATTSFNFGIGSYILKLLYIFYIFEQKTSNFILDRICKLADNCTGPQSFLLFHATGGGAGSDVVSIFL